MGLFAQVEFSTLFFLMAVVLVIGFLLFRSHRYLARQDRGRSPIVRTDRPETPDRGHHLDAPPDVLRWEVQMHETARDLSARLDSKMGVLEQLIHEADRAAARLEAAVEAARSCGAKTPAPVEAVGEAPESAEPPDGPPARPVSQAEGLKSRGAAPQASTVPVAEEAEARPPAERRYEEIYLLADYGFDAAEIARRVGTPVGEVELILGLRGKR